MVVGTGNTRGMVKTKAQGGLTLHLPSGLAIRSQSVSTKHTQTYFFFISITFTFKTRQSSSTEHVSVWVLYFWHFFWQNKRWSSPIHIHILLLGSATTTTLQSWRTKLYPVCCSRHGAKMDGSFCVGSHYLPMEHHGWVSLSLRATCDLSVL